MFPVTGLLAPAVTSLVAFLLWKCFQLVWYRAYKSPLHRLRGPKGTSFILGNLNELIKDENGELMEKWVREYGGTLRFKGFLSKDQLFTMDLCAISHVLAHNSDYQKSPITRQGLAEIFGEGLLLVEGSQHRRQRHIMNPAFGPAQIRALTDTFIAKSFQLRDLWASEITKGSTAAITSTCIDVMPWLNRATFDIIGLTGFNYDFNSLDSSRQLNKVGEAFSTMCLASQNMTVLDIILRSLVPVLRFMPTTQTRKLRAAQHTMMQMGRQLLMDAKAATQSNEAGKEEIRKDGLRGRDLLSLLVKANIASDISEDQKLSDGDVIAQVSTFFIAGHETTSTAVAWALYALTQAPEVQTKLREELLSVNTDTPSMDELMALPYLDTVVRETLRVHAPVTGIVRTAMKDDVLPVEKPYVDRYGVVRDTIVIAKGDEVVVSIQAMNRSRELWGPDAHEFKPERWNDIPDAVSRVPGVWGHMLTFIGGPRACIGYRFSLVEFKAILFVLVRAFEFELAVPASEVCGSVILTRRPALRNDPNRAQLPLLIRPYQSA